MIEHLLQKALYLPITIDILQHTFNYNCPKVARGLKLYLKWKGVRICSVLRYALYCKFVPLQISFKRLLMPALGENFESSSKNSLTIIAFN